MGNSIKQKIIEKVLYYPKIVISIIAILSALFISGIPLIVQDDDMVRLLPDDLPSIKTFADITEEFGNYEFMYVAVGNPGRNIFTSDFLKTTWNISKEFENLKECEEVTFTNLSFEINENDIISWYWNFGDGNTSEQISPLHSYLDYGIYDVSLIIFDEYGQYSEPHMETIYILDLTGDINYDNLVNIVDIVTLINLVLYPADDINFEADLNNDGMLSILDIILLVNIILDN